VNEQADAGNLDVMLGSASVKAGHNHIINQYEGGNSHNAFAGSGLSGSKIWSQIINRDLGEMRNIDADLTSRPVSSPSPSGIPQFGYGTAAYDVPQQAQVSSYLAPHYHSSVDYGASFHAENSPMNYQMYSPPTPYGGQYSQGPPPPPIPQDGFWRPALDAGQPSPAMGQGYGAPYGQETYDQQYRWPRGQNPGEDYPGTQFPERRYL